MWSIMNKSINKANVEVYLLAFDFSMLYISIKLLNLKTIFLPDFMQSDDLQIPSRKMRVYA